MRLVASFVAVILWAGCAAAQPSGAARECTRPGEAGCEQPLLVTGGQCNRIAGNTDPRWRGEDVDRIANACWTCDDLDMDIRFGEQLGFFRCQPRTAAPAPGPTVTPTEPAWQQRDCTSYGLRRESGQSLALTVRNRCDYQIAVNACASWYGGRERGTANGTAPPGDAVVLRWPVDVYTRADVVWNFCRAGEACPAPCPAGR